MFAGEVTSNEALHYEQLVEGRVHCHLCGHDCKIAEGKRGICGVRENQGGTLHSLIMGRMSSMNSDPIEKKPLYHFHPSTMALSFGTIGCNFSCAHCQNYSITSAQVGSFNLKRLDVAEIPKDQTLAGLGRKLGSIFVSPLEDAGRKVGLLSSM